MKSEQTQRSPRTRDVIVRTRGRANPIPHRPQGFRGSGRRGDLASPKAFVSHELLHLTDSTLKRLSNDSTIQRVTRRKPKRGVAEPEAAQPDRRQ